MHDYAVSVCRSNHGHGLRHESLSDLIAEARSVLGPAFWVYVERILAVDVAASRSHSMRPAAAADTIRCAHEGTAVRDAGDLEAHCMQPLRMARRLRNCVCTLWVLYDDAISGKQKEGSSNTEPDSSATARKSCRLPKRREIVALIGIADLRWHEELSS